MYSILIVDDQVIEATTIKKVIEDRHLPLQVSIANNGLEALAIAQSISIDIVFTDIKMPRMDGLTLARRIKEASPNVQLIIYSAFGEFEYAQKAIGLGVVHYLLKPLDVAEFLHVMEKAIALCERETRIREALRERDDTSKYGIYGKYFHSQNEMHPVQETDESSRKVVRDIQELVGSEYGNSDLDIEYLASKVFLSASYLGHLFKAQTGQSLGKYIVRVRMEHARHLLATTHIKIADIGNRVGYPNPSNFALQFKKYFGCTPIQFRERG
ncbi:response regulator [Paenibacillus sp. GCM10027626]|uniref:response regulator transcription factor n=1 Tax=Paenibacillus sp. GCM10027626 TaxID=3273411 RepID=UPI0036447295